MGMDVYGNKPKNQRGKYFGLNSAGWHPLATYMCEVAPKITAKCRHWHSNDFDGLNAEDSLQLPTSCRRRSTVAAPRDMRFSSLSLSRRTNAAR